MAAKKTQAGYEYIVDQLNKNKAVSYADIKASADKKGLVVHPIMYGRAKAQLGLVPVSARGKGKAAKKAAAKAGGAVRRGPGRPRKNAAPGIDTSSLEGIISAVKGSQQEKERFRSALEKIQQILDSVLG